MRTNLLLSNTRVMNLGVEWLFEQMKTLKMHVASEDACKFGELLLKAKKFERNGRIMAQIEVLEKHIEHPRKPGYKRHDVLDRIKVLEKRLN